jgi:hypothetical protein
LIKTKKAYITPHLAFHGNVEALTLGGGQGHYTRGKGGGNAFGYGHCKNATPGHPEDYLSCGSFS